MAESKLEKLLKNVNKGLEKAGITEKVTLGTDKVTEFISTGVPEFDLALGGGVAKGKVIHLYGQPSGGKSWLSLKIIAEAQKKGLTCAFLDCEKSYDKSWATKLGVVTDNLFYYPVSGAEITMQAMRTLVENEVDVVVLDSIAALVTKDEIDKTFDQEAKMAGTARLMSKAMRVLNSRGAGNVTMIFINQIRDNVGAFSPTGTTPITTPGGKAVKFYASQEINVKRGQDIKTGSGKDTVFEGYEMNILVDKNKVAPPKGRASISVLKDGSFDIYEMVGNMALRNDLFGPFEKNGNTYLLKGEKIAGKRDEFISYLRTNQVAFEELKKSVLDNLFALKFDKFEEKTEDLNETDEKIIAEVEGNV